MSTLDCCSQTSTFVAPSQTINFPEFSLNQGTTNNCVLRAFVNVYRGPIAILQTAIESLTQPGPAVSLMQLTPSLTIQLLISPLNHSLNFLILFF